MKLTFKLTDETKINAFGVKLFRIEATADIPSIGIKKGDKGGWLDTSKTPDGKARVFGEAWVFGEALLIKADLWEILLHALPEIPALRQAIIDGKIDGSIYEGDCACLISTIAKFRSCSYKDLDGIEPDSQRLAERYFMGLSPGDTPENNKTAETIIEWIDELIGLLKLSTLGHFVTKTRP